MDRLNHSLRHIELSDSLIADDSCCVDVVVLFNVGLALLAPWPLASLVP